MKLLKMRAAYGLLLLLATASCLAGDKAEAESAAMQAVMQFSAHLQTYSASFTQRVYSENGRLMEESGGTMALAIPDRLCWRYTAPFEQWVIADGKKIWTWDVDLEQVTVKDQATSASDSPLYLLMAPERLADTYRLELGVAVDDMTTVALIPLEPRADFEWVDLGFTDQLLTRLVIQDAFGQQTVIELTEGERNPQLAADTFDFVPPEGVDILGAEELGLENLTGTE